jgi:hypothetical protein
MTRGRYDGSYIVEVQTFHQTHPAYVFDADLLRGHGAGLEASEPADDGGAPDAKEEAEAAALEAGDDLDADGGGAGLSATDAS